MSSRYVQQVQKSTCPSKGVCFACDSSAFSRLSHKGNLTSPHTVRSLGPWANLALFVPALGDVAYSQVSFLPFVLMRMWGMGRKRTMVFNGREQC